MNVVFNAKAYHIWFMASSDKQGNVHASVNIADPSGRKSIKTSFAKKCSNLLIHRLPDGAYIECCQSYKQLKKSLRHRWKGRVTGASLGSFSDDISSLAAFMNENIEEDFSILGSGTNCTRFAIGFGHTLGFDESTVLGTCVTLLEKVVPARKRAEALARFAATLDA